MKRLILIQDGSGGTLAEAELRIVDAVKAASVLNDAILHNPWILFLQLASSTMNLLLAEGKDAEATLLSVRGELTFGESPTIKGK